MANEKDEKRSIVEDLARARMELSDQTIQIRRGLDVSTHVQTSIRRHSYGWLSVAAIFGWILSRLPTRKRKIYLEAGTKRKLGEKGAGGGLLGLLFKSVWGLARPVVTAYFTKKLSDSMAK